MSIVFPFVCGYLAMASSLGLLCRIAALLSGQVTYVLTCPAGHYDAAGACWPCSSCGEGQYASEACSDSHDIVCSNCSVGTFSSPRAGARVCANCTECRPSREETVLCSQFHDARCGDCASGYFLSISSDGESACKKCSRCPPDHSAVHWVECEQAGLPLEQQCAPAADKVPTLTLSSPSPSPTGVTMEPFLSTDRGGFLTESESGPSELTTATPPTAIGIATAVGSSLLATLTLLLVCIGGVVYSVRNRVKSRARQSNIEQDRQLLPSPLVEESGDDPPATPHQYRQSALRHSSITHSTQILSL